MVAPGSERLGVALARKPVAERGEIPEGLGCETLLLGRGSGILFGGQI